MTTKSLHVCSFDALPDLGNVKTYRQLKALVLKAGRFSIFEATQNQRVARLFVKLSKDPEVDVQPIGFPWSTVEKIKRLGEMSAKRTKPDKSHDTISEDLHKTRKK